MIKTIRKVGNLQVLVFDRLLCKLTGLKVGDEVNVMVDENRMVTITPVRRRAEPAVVAGTIRQTIGDYSKMLKKLA